MPHVEDRTRLEQAYSDALAAYVKVLRTLHPRLVAGSTCSEDIRLELDARSRLETACRECCDA